MTDSGPELPTTKKSDVFSAEHSSDAIVEAADGVDTTAKTDFLDESSS